MPLLLARHLLLCRHAAEANPWGAIPMPGVRRGLLRQRSGQHWLRAVPCQHVRLCGGQRGVRGVPQRHLHCAGGGIHARAMRGLPPRHRQLCGLRSGGVSNPERAGALPSGARGLLQPFAQCGGAPAVRGGSISGFARANLLQAVPRLHSDHGGGCDRLLALPPFVDGLRAELGEPVRRGLRAEPVLGLGRWDLQGVSAGHAECGGHVRHGPKRLL